MTNCPQCGGTTTVKYTVSDYTGTYRKRKCKNCGHVFVTHEFVNNTPAVRSKFNDLRNRRNEK